MTQESHDIRLVREVLEGVLAPKLAQAVLFEALGSARELPNTTTDLLHLVRGPVHESVQERAGSSQATAVVARLEHMLARRLSQPPPPADGDATVAVPTHEEAVHMLIVASGPWFGGRLSAALGPERVAPAYASHAAALEGAWDAHFPAVVLVDATDFPAIDPGALAAGLRGLPGTTTVAIWGSELPYGRKVRFALEEGGVGAMAFEQAGGIDPLLDLIRSRRRQ
jgi:hypothetical protein